MHTILTRRMPHDTVDQDTGEITSPNHKTVMPILLAVGVAAIALISLSGCKQLNGNMTDAAVSRPVAFLQTATDDHDSQWISKAHALAAKNSTDGAVTDLSY